MFVALSMNWDESMNECERHIVWSEQIPNDYVQTNLHEIRKISNQFQATSSHHIDVIVMRDVTNALAPTKTHKWHSLSFRFLICFYRSKPHYYRNIFNVHCSVYNVFRCFDTLKPFGRGNKGTKTEWSTSRVLEVALPHFLPNRIRALNASWHKSLQIVSRTEPSAIWLR